MVRIAEVHDCFTATRDGHGSKNEIHVLEKKIQWVLWNPFQIVFFLYKEAADQRDIMCLIQVLLLMSVLLIVF